MSGEKRANRRRLFVTAFMQVFLVSANTYFISRVARIGVAACGFGISYLWTLNVRRISVSHTTDRLIYASGAMLGGMCGVMFSTLILK
ncbi:MAG TPA: hypothetical protein PLF99_03920 [Tenuifilaceae bacterium]|nr:hypothetical protein [Tenuifilaceae bacterium]